MSGPWTTPVGVTSVTVATQLVLQPRNVLAAFEVTVDYSATTLSDELVIGSGVQNLWSYDITVSASNSTEVRRIMSSVS